jgi:hypothetical protein
MPIDPREIRPVRTKLYELITTDRPCGKCGYNLRGLPSNGKCPECGRAITGLRGSNRFSDNLGDAPLFYLKAVALGACLLAVFSIVCAYAFAFVEAGPTIRIAGIAGVASIAWWVGVYILTGKRQIGDHTLPDAVLDSIWLRRINRAMQLAWPLAVIAWVLFIRSGPPVNQIARVGALGLQIVGAFGLVPLSVHLSSLADWAGDTGLAERFRISAWALAVCGIISQAGSLSKGFAAGNVPSVGGGFLWFGSIWATLGLSITQIVFLFSLFQLAHISVWAILNSSKAAEASRRLLEQRERHEREMARRTATASALNPTAPVPGRLPPKPKPPRA